MRIVAGAARGRRLEAPKDDKTRPTLERVKEGIFSAVQFWLPGASVLDLFAGSGQLGFEALSRGAKNCVFIDASPEAVALIRRNAEATGLAAACRILRSDAKSFLEHSADVFDVVLMDPPYGEAWPGLLAQAARLCAPGALVLFESAAGFEMPAAAGGLCFEKQYRYGTVRVSRYRMAE